MGYYSIHLNSRYHDLFLCITSVLISPYNNLYDEIYPTSPTFRTNNINVNSFLSFFILCLKTLIDLHLISLVSFVVHLRDCISVRTSCFPSGFIHPVSFTTSVILHTTLLKILSKVSESGTTMWVIPRKGTYTHPKNEDCFLISFPIPYRTVRELIQCNTLFLRFHYPKRGHYFKLVCSEGESSHLV